MGDEKRGPQRIFKKHSSKYIASLELTRPSSPFYATTSLKVELELVELDLFLILLGLDLT